MLSLIFSNSVAVAGVPYESYNYDYWEVVVPSPAPYVPEDSLSGSDLGVERLNQPSDIYITKGGEIYLVDTGNNRIIVFNDKWNVERIIDRFSNDGKSDTFNKPQGIFVNDRGNIYVADTENKRVVVLSPDLDLILCIDNPKSETFDENFSFTPLKVGVDYADRVYVVGKGVFEGIMSFTDKGEFHGYLGTIKVTIGITDIIWRSISTKAQRQRQQLYIPTEFTGLDLDESGFVYTTNVDIKSDETIKRLNPSGDDVLKRPEDKFVKGDLFFRPAGRRYTGPSQFIDIVVRDKGLYSAIDSQRGRIFTYDHEGNLLYIFGSIGSQVGTFKNPSAIEAIGDKIIVVDKERGELIIFKPTQYGDLINKAIGLRYDGEEEKAVEYWEKVLKLDANFELAYVGIGKSLLAKNKNKEALKYLKLGMDQKYYSIAYKRYRNEVLKSNLVYIMNGIFILVILYMGYKIYRKFKRRGKKINA
ncbi:MAG: gluconolactonase [Epulopiscium sp.]|nr:gluconolactonase [Candidatus Epulonipiscium sp.]